MTPPDDENIRAKTASPYSWLRFKGGSRTVAIILLAILAYALAIRIGRCFVTDKLDQDSILYIDMANAWANSGIEAAFKLHIRIPPLYPALMAFGKWAGLEAETAGRLISIFAGTASVLAAYIIGRLALRSTWLALFGTALVATHPYLVRISESILRDSLYICLEAWAIAFAMLGARSRKLYWLWWLAAGTTAALAEMTRAEAYEIIILIGLWTCWELWLKRKDLRRKLFRTVAGSIAACIVFFALTIPAQIWLEQRTGSQWGSISKPIKEFQGLFKKARQGSSAVPAPGLAKEASR